MDAVFLSNTADEKFYEMTKASIESLRNSARGFAFDITLVETNKNHDSMGFTYEDCRVIVPDEPFNYNKFMRIGVAAGSDSVVLMSNNDVLYSPRCMDELFAAMSVYGFRSVSPYEPNWHRRYYGETPPENPVVGYEVENHVCGWSICAERSLLLEAGVLDEDFMFWFQDNNYAMALRSLGVQHALVPHGQAIHRFSGSHGLLGENKELMTHGQRSVFQSKWS